MNLRLSLVGSARPGSHLFGAEGGAFGRSQKCDWVLPDDERILSSVHGRLVFKSGEFMLVDESTNGIFVNGLPEPLGRGNSVVLSNGTRFSAGRYTVEVQLVPADRSEARSRSGPAHAAQQPAYRHDQHFNPAAGRNAEDALRDGSELGSLWGQNSQDPLAYMNESAEAGTGAPLDRQQIGADPYGAQAQYGQQAHVGHPGYPPSLPPERSSRAVFDDDPGAHDPLRSLGHGQAAPDHPTSLTSAPSYGHPVQPTPPPGRIAPAGQAPGSTVIPEDFLSSFSMPRKVRAEQPASGFQQSAPARPASNQPPPMHAQTPGSTSVIPDGFNPFAMKPVQPPADPRLAAPRPPEASYVPDEPRTSLAAAQQPPRTAAERPNGLSPALMADIVEFGGPKGGTLDTLEALKARREQRKAAMLKKSQSDGGVALPPGPPLPNQPPAAFAPPAASPMRQAPAVELSGLGGAVSGTNGAGGEALVRAFLEGMGFPDAEVASGDYGRLMREAGGTVRSMAAGLILLLSARKMVKSEFRMDETQVQPDENNPFKFFKVAELALDELFVTRSGGFQPPAEAAKSAFEDLEQHTMLTMSAMQRAIKLIFERLSPNSMAGGADDQGGGLIRGLGGRKGKLETLAESHEKMGRNIDNVARQVIAEAFAQVQEEHARSRAKQYWGKKP